MKIKKRKNMDRINRVLFITQLVEMGGGEKSLLSTIENLNKSRFQPIVLCPKQGSLTSELEKRNIKVIIFPFGIAKKLLGFIPIVSINTTIRTCNVLIREKIDLVHSNCFYGVVVSSIFTKLMKIPLVWTVHGWTSGEGVQGYLINFFVDKILAVSTAVKNFISKPGHISTKKIEALFLGINLKEYNNQDNSNKIRKEFGIEKNVPLIGMIGRFQSINNKKIKCYFHLMSFADANLGLYSKYLFSSNQAHLMCPKGTCVRNESATA